MAAVKGSKKNESKKNDKSETPVYAKSWEDPEWRRHEVVDPHRVHTMLEKLKLATNGKELERTDRLSFYYVHEAQQKHLQLARCLPNDDADPLGCGFASDETLDVCPFCGSGAEVVVAPKAPPPADRDIELNVKAAEKKAEDKPDDAPKAESKPEPKKSGDNVAKVSSKDVKKKKEARGEVVEDKPAEPAKEAPKPDAIVPVAPEAIDLPSESVGGTAADLDRLTKEIISINESVMRENAHSAWKMGRLLKEIRDRKLWSSVRHEDGSYAFANFNSYVAQSIDDFTPDHAMLLIKVAAFATEEQMEIGIAKVKYILESKLPDNVTADLFAFANAKDDKGKLLHSALDLRAKIKELKNPQLPAPSTGQVLATLPDEDDEDRDDDLDDDEDDDADDEDADDEPESSRPAQSKPKAQPAQMTSVSFEKREFSVPLAIKGSQVKPAKKIQDEPHGTLSLPGGTKIHFVLKIGDDGQIFVDGKVETPY